ncbi:MAG: electron transfer flavoprotein subunit beta/FixA family protein [Thermodesulfobacteriota bacterium]
MADHVDHAHERKIPARGVPVKPYMSERSFFDVETLFGSDYLVTMKILVCIKQVPDSAESLAVDEGTGVLSCLPSTVFRMNRFDEFALEEALLIREHLPGTRVDVLSLGPERVSAGIQRALGMGADHGIHILDRTEGYVSPFTVASLIAACVAARNYELIMTGVMAEDTLAAQTGQLIAALLDLPCATSVIQEDLRPERGEILVEREIEGGSRQTKLLKLPAVLTIQPGINLPRYPSFSKVMRAQTYPQELIGADGLAIPEPREARRGVRIPEAAAPGVFLEGSPREKARKLIGILHEKSLLSRA